MTFTSWKFVSYTVAFSFLVMFLDRRTGAALEGSAVGHLDLPYSQETVVFPHIVRVSDVEPSHTGHTVVSRRRRNILFPSGVKLCAQETPEQVVSNHLSYFHLRVCQETIWEAFKIFWDRLPEQDEYQSWMSQCQEGAVTAQDIGSYFSQSEEHRALVKKRISMPGLKSETTRSWQNICSSTTPGTPEAAEVPELEDVAKGEEAVTIVPEVEESTLDNDIAVQFPSPAALEQVVELSILLTGELYSDDLHDPVSLHFQTLSRQLTEKIEASLEKLPGFRSVSVLDFRPQKETQGLDGVVVDYAVTVVVDAAGVSTEQLDYLTLQSNHVENSYHEVKELPTVVYTVSEVKNLDTEALESVSEISESVSAADITMVASDTVVGEPSEVTVLEDDVLSGTISEVTPGNYITVLDENTIVSALPVLISSAPEADSIQEEGLLMEDTVQMPAVENPPPLQELPTQLPSAVLVEDVTLPVLSVDTEASGELEELLQPTTATEEDVDVSLEETAAEDILITEDVAVAGDATSEADLKTVVKEPTSTLVNLEDLLASVFVNEVPEEQERSTTATETKEEGLPALVPPPEAADVLSEILEPESTETGLHPVDEDPEDVAKNVVFGDSEPSETGKESEFTTTEGREVMEDPETPEAPVVKKETLGAPTISIEDLTEDEVLQVNKGESEPPVTYSLSPTQPTGLSPERESPFTRISDVGPASEGQPSLVEVQTIEGLDDVTNGDQGYDVVHHGYGLINHTEEGSTGFPFGVAHGTDQASIAMPANPGRALMVFFSLRVTNMVFSDDLFNKSSPEYKALEQRFLELLVPYLQSNLSHFENLEILNFRNGSIVVNSRMKFGKPVARGVTTTVYLILEDFCNTAYQTMNLAIDKYSLDVESGDQADPCKFQACNEYAECQVNKWSGEAECVCNAGYFSVDGLPCQSICELETDFCLNDGKCDIIPGQGAICRCRVGENWWYRGEHCEEYVSEPLVVGIAVASVAGFLLVASGVIFFLARTLRDQYDKDETEDPIREAESLPSLERATKYNPMYESEVTTGYSHYYRRYPEFPHYSSASAEASTDFSSEEIRHIYENSELTKEEIQDRIRIIELYAKDRQFADFVRQHQVVLDTCRENSSAQS
ncbi:interphotoreceptor matrix proteoglycan 2 isoform X1 [Solea solea]|uniref:interphotoreceptor matrix proteoglycan 2 isoform X1 n=2 Tax=Solea solea TaxID=90069 RepID=UPI00272D3BA6|nr:interphotoreceptor matrix proteoglycan 2 isoform X1 [Solea solea]